MRNNRSDPPVGLSNLLGEMTVPQFFSKAVTWLQVQRQAAVAEGEKAKRTAQHLLALAHQTSKVTEAYEVSHAVPPTAMTSSCGDACVLAALCMNMKDPDLVPCCCQFCCTAYPV